MPVIEVPRHEWGEFCNRFKRQHYGWLTTLKLQEKSDNKTIIADQMALQDITVHIRNDEQGELKIILGQKPDRGFVHRIQGPLYLHTEETPEGFHTGLQVLDAQGNTTHLRFRATALPEQLDGIILD